MFRLRNVPKINFPQTVLIVHFQITGTTIKDAMKLQNSLIAPFSADLHERHFHFTLAKLNPLCFV